MSNVSPFGELFRSSSYLLSGDENCGRMRAQVHEEQCESTDESDGSAPSACGKKKRRVKATKLKEEQLDLQCEWRDCDYHTSNLDHFVRHVSLHIPHLEAKGNEDQEGTGSVVFLRILHTSSSTWQCNLSSHLLVHINPSSFFYLNRVEENMGNNRININPFLS
jgi:hypothetical protein